MNLKRILSLGFLFLSLVFFLVLLGYDKTLDFFRFNHIIYLRNLGNWEKAIAEFQRYFSGKELSEKKLSYILDLFVMAKRFTEAKDFALQLLKKNKLNPDYRFRLGLLYHLICDFDSAQKSFLEFRNFTETLNRDLEDEKSLLARSYTEWHKQNWTQIIKNLQDSPLLTERQIGKREWERLIYEKYLLALLNFLLGSSYVHLGQYIEARGFLEKALNYNPRDPVIYFYLGLTHFLLGDDERGEYYSSISRVILPEIKTLVKKSFPSPALLANFEQDFNQIIPALLFLQDYDYAQELLDLITTNTVNAANYYFLKGEVSERLNKREQAITYYQQSLSHSSGNKLAIYKLNYLQKEKITSEDFFDLCERVIEIEELPHNGDYLKHASFIAMVKNDQHIVINYRDLLAKSQPQKSITLGLVGRSFLSNQIGALVGVYFNDVLIKYLYFPSAAWQLKMFTTPFHSFTDEIKILFLNDYIPVVDDGALRDDRNVYIDKVLIFKD